MNTTCQDCNRPIRRRRPTSIAAKQRLCDTCALRRIITKRKP